MSQSARVHSVEILQEFQEAVQRFRQDAARALDSVALEVRRAFDWLDDQLTFWQAEKRRREDEVTLARAELERRKMVKLFGREPDTSEQEKALRLAQARLREAEEKIQTCRRWGPDWQRAADDYLGHARQLGGMLDADVPRAVALLGRRLEALEAYLATTAPSLPSPVESGQPSGIEPPQSGPGETQKNTVE